MVAGLIARTRSLVPRLPEPVVRRPRLEATLASGVRHQLTLVSAPPGAGKTTLLAGWLRDGGAGLAAWLTVESRDNEYGRFADVLVDALVEAGAVAGPDVTGRRG